VESTLLEGQQIGRFQTRASSFREDPNARLLERKRIC
jgi:hypothetical protein